MFLRNIGVYLQVHMALQAKRQTSTTILSATLCESETQPLTLTEERRLIVLGNKVLGRIFGPNRQKVTMRNESVP
jgi:hypothetical protein